MPELEEEKMTALESASYFQREFILEENVGGTSSMAVPMHTKTTGLF